MKIRLLIAHLLMLIAINVHSIELTEVLAIYAKQQTQYLDTKIQVYEYDWNEDGQLDYFMSCDDSVLCPSTKNGAYYALFISVPGSNAGFVQNNIYTKPFDQFVRLKDGRIALLSTINGGGGNYSTNQYTVNQRGELEAKTNTIHEYQELGGMQLLGEYQAMDVLPEADKKIRLYGSEDILNHLTSRSGQRDVSGKIIWVEKYFLMLDDGTELYIGDDVSSEMFVYPASEETMLQMYYVEMNSRGYLDEKLDGSVRFVVMKTIAQEWLDQHPESARLYEKVKSYCWPREVCPAGTPKITLEEIFQGKVALARPNNSASVIKNSAVMDNVNPLPNNQSRSAVESSQFDNKVYFIAVIAFAIAAIFLFLALRRKSGKANE